MGRATWTYSALILTALTSGCKRNAADTLCSSPTALLFAHTTISNFLTASHWSSGCSGGARSTCHSLDFAPDGQFSWSAFSDYNERDGYPKKWTLELCTRNSGLIHVDDGSAMPFERSGSDLKLGAITFSPSPKSSPPKPFRQRVNQFGMEGPPSTLFSKLVGIRWKRTDPFNSNGAPEAFFLDPHGRFVAWYRHESCVATGMFGINGSTLTTTTEPNECDIRTTPPSPTGLTPADGAHFDGELLVLHLGTFRPELNHDPSHALVFPYYPNELGVKATWVGEFPASGPVAMTLTLTNPSDHGFVIRSAAVYLQQLSGGPTGLARIDPPQTLAKDDYGDFVLAPGAQEVRQLLVTFPVWKSPAEFELDIRTVEKSGSESWRRQKFSIDQGP